MSNQGRHGTWPGESWTTQVLFVVFFPLAHWPLYIPHLPRGIYLGPTSLLRWGRKGSLWVTSPLISYYSKALGAQWQTQWDLDYFPGNVLSEPHAKPPSVAYLAAIKSCRNLSHSKPVFWFSWALTSPHMFTKWHCGLWTGFSPTLQDHSIPLLHTEYLPFTENTTERRRKGSSQWIPDRHTATGEPDQLNVINWTVEPWPHVMSKTPKASPELISKTPNTTHLT